VCVVVKFGGGDGWKSGRVGNRETWSQSSQPFS
jgi:hypothetical protein